MSSRFIEALHDLDGVTLHPGGSSSIFKNLDNQYGIVLPQAHQMLLRESNGIEVYWGYFRLFGLETSEGVDVTKWNRHDCWKFAWKDRCTGYWCFGETAWGDQYAYALESLHGKQSPEVYVLSAFSMTPHLAERSFTEFLEDEFIRCARTPYDATIERARRNLGPIEADNHLIYVPSLLLGATEDANTVEQMTARLAMIVNGDIAVQLDGGPRDGAVKAVQTYEDESGRTRLRLVWA